MPCSILNVCPLRGVGNKNIHMIGRVKCKIHYQNKQIIHDIYIIPDNEAVVLLLIGCDVLRKFNIFYAVTKLNIINMKY